jgi:hypothetical protein
LSLRAAMDVCQGWAYKRKSAGAKSRFLSQFNKRFFTLDFTRGLWFYSHNAENKKVSLPQPFSDLVRVTPISLPEGGKSSMVGLMSKEPSTANGLLLQTQSKDMEIFFVSRFEAEQWQLQFDRAIAIGGGNAPSRCPTAMSHTTESTVVPASRGSDSPTEQAAEVRPGMGRDAMAMAVAMCDTGAVSQPVREIPLRAPVAVPPPLAGTQDIETETLPAVRLPAEQPRKVEASGWSLNSALADVDAILETLPDSATQPVKVEQTIPGCHGHPAEDLSRAWAPASTAPDEGGRAYRDHGAGMSMTDRLAAMELSDYGSSDSEDEAPARSAPKPLAPAPAPVVFEPVTEPAAAPAPAPAFPAAEVTPSPALQREHSWDDDRVPAAPAAGGLQREHSWDDPEPAEPVLLRESSWDD